MNAESPVSLLERPDPEPPGASPRPGAAFADAAAARAAVELVRPAIEAALEQDGVSGQGVLHLVMLDPACSARDTDFEQAVLHEASIGDRVRWDVDHAWRAICG